jgi:hypothetical protein
MSLTGICFFFLLMGAVVGGRAGGGGGAVRSLRWCVRVCVCAAAVREMGEMEYIKGLPVLENLDLSDTPLFTKAQSLAKRFFFVVYLLARPFSTGHVSARARARARERESFLGTRGRHIQECANGSVSKRGTKHERSCKKVYWLEREEA